ncbi:MAG: extracellular solute-binding protein [Candidatus Caenarcaniphilales bacterium]|nr:extracellular solute-binding protein [Candidatus Caenarcaniphilales bacterium]
MMRRNVLYTCLIILFFATPFVYDYIDSRGGYKASDKAEIEFWQYWSGPEKKPLEKLVNQFNEEDYDFRVKLRTISLPRKKILMSITAGMPPDLVHLDGDMVNDFALRNALQAMDFEGLTLEKEDFLESYLKMLEISGKQYAVPLMPTAEAMHINSSLLNKFKLEEPETLEDIIKISDEIIAQADFKQFGFLPTWPIWTGRMSVYLFHGAWAKPLDDSSYEITANLPENIRAWNWLLDNFISKIPQDELQAFIEGKISYQSPDNPFYSGKVAIESNGIWEHGFVKKFASQYEIKVKAFPDIDGVTENPPTELTVDALAIPRGARHYRETMEFISWLLSKENISYLAKEQNKFPPLKLSEEEEKDFVENHKHPYVDVFMDIAKSKNAYYFPHLSFSKEYKREIKKAFDYVLRLEKSPEEALNDLQFKMLVVQGRF